MKNNRISIIYKFLFVLTIILGGGFFITSDGETLSKFELMICVIPMFLICFVGGGLWMFFSNQIVDIKCLNEEVYFYKLNGKIISANKKAIDVVEKNNRYIFIIDDIRKISAYKYMPPSPLSHKYAITSKVMKTFK